MIFTLKLVNDNTDELNLYLIRLHVLSRVFFISCISGLVFQNMRKKKDKRQYDPMSGQLPSAKELENINKIPGAYENTATLDHRAIAQEAQQKQDKIGRYTNDPTAKKVCSLLGFFSPIS